MRVAVHHPDGAVSAHKFGRIEDGVHNVHPLFGSMPIHEFVDEVIKQAKEDNPDCKVVVERMAINPDNPEESVWIPDEEFDSNVHEATPAGNQVSAPTLAATVSQEAR